MFVVLPVNVGQWAGLKGIQHGGPKARIVEGIKEHNLKAVMTFIDFKKAFDMVHGGIMLKILKAYGVPGSLVAAIAVVYKNTRARVLTPYGRQRSFRHILESYMLTGRHVGTLYLCDNAGLRP